MTDLLKRKREFDQHIEIQQVDSARTDWHEARCTAGPTMDCWSTTGIRRIVEDAVREHIERDHSPHCPDCDAPPAPPTAAQPPAVNETFRAYVTGSAFRLDLGKTLIEALVHIDWVLRLEAAGGHRLDRSTYVRSPSLFATGAPGLQRRGLIWHQYDGSRTDKRPFSDFYGITPAGKLVIELLKEAGIWAEYVALYPEPIRAAA